MKALVIDKIVSVEENPQPLKLIEIPIPQPAEDEILIKVSACGVCHTELDEIEGRTKPPHLPIVPGHEVVGRVVKLGAVWAGNTEEKFKDEMHAIIDNTPVWKPVVEALKNLKPGGRLVINTIRKQDSDKKYLLNLSYHENLWMEREIKSVANVTKNDIARFL
jgi:D-arabinose 1-dehydrogenase-like Zn-dependent alcohol dehydrogenase